MEIKGIKINLRDWNDSDMAVYERWQKPGHRWQELDAPYYKSAVDKSKQDTEDLINWRIKNEIGEPRLGLAIADPKSNTLLGCVNSYWESIETNWLCIGLVIYDPDHWGQRIGYESLGLWIDYLFAERPEIVRLDMRTWSGNQGLQGLAKKLGFYQEARFRKACIIKGQYYDGLGFGILRDEWEGQFPNGFTSSRV